jgi:hypothetical protein
MILQLLGCPYSEKISCRWKFCTLRDKPPILILKKSSGDLLRPLSFSVIGLESGDL